MIAELVKLGELVAEGVNNFVDGPFGSNLKASEYQDSGIPIIRLQNIRPHQFRKKDIKFISQQKADELSRHDFRSGDLVIAKLGDPTGVACIVPDDMPAGRIVADVVRFRGDKNRVDHAYISRFLNSPNAREQLERGTTGTTRKRINLTKLKAVSIPLPPLEQQKRIADILDAADALRVKRRQVLEQLDELVQSVFLEMFGDPVTNPKGLEIKQLGDVADLYSGSTLPDGVTFANQQGGYLLLKVSDLNDPANKTFITKAQLWGESSIKGIVAPKNAVVIPKRGGAIGTNKKRLLARPAILDPNLMAIGVGKQLHHQFLYRWFHTFDLLSITSGSSVPQLNKKDLNPLLIPLPPLELQNRFAEIVSAIEAQKVRVREHLTELDALFASLQQQAFSGEL